jgi:hypothetical protein
MMLPRLSKISQSRMINIRQPDTPTGDIFEPIPHRIDNAVTGQARARVYPQNQCH